MKCDKFMPIVKLVASMKRLTYVWSMLTKPLQNKTIYFNSKSIFYADSSVYEKRQSATKNVS